MPKYDVQKMLQNGNKRYTDTHTGAPKIWIEEARDGFVLYDVDSGRMEMTAASEADREKVAKYRVVA